MNDRLVQITASAGSGKTYTLTRRFLAHLASATAEPFGNGSCQLMVAGAAPSCSLGSILAATFTNKAAAEMLGRVIRELKQQALAADGGDPDFPLSPEESRRWVGFILRRFDSLNIRTIDSLLTMLVRLNALSLSLPPDFRLVFSLADVFDPLYDQLLDRVDHKEAGPGLEPLFRDACRSLLFHDRAKGVAAGSLLRNRLAELLWLHVRGQVLPGREDGQGAAALLASLHADMREAARSLSGLAGEERLELLANAATFLERCAACPPMTVPAFADSYADKEDLDDWLKKAGRGRSSEDARQALADLLQAYRRLKQDGPALALTVEFMPLVSLARPLIQGCEALQREQGLVHASRLPSLALASLEGPGGVSEAFCRFGESLYHILFDEFQDTSTDQWRSIHPLAVNCLSRGGTLTYVGDGKQAIYGWRGGNAALFDQVAGDPELTAMLDAGPSRETLERNWRTAPAVVEFNNRVFGRLADPAIARRLAESILPSNADPALTVQAAHRLASSFTGCAQSIPPGHLDRPGYVRLTRVERATAPELTAACKAVLGDLLAELLERRPPGDLAILVRKNSEATEVAAWLAEWEIPSVTEHSFRLGAHPLISRLIDALTFLEYPLDDAAFWSAVSGPELFGHAGPDYDGLVEWLAACRAFPGGPPLYAAFMREFPEAWQTMLAPFHERAGLLGTYDIVCELIRHCRLLERHPRQAPFIRRFMEVAHRAENAGHSSLSAFLEFWAESGQDERVPMPETMNAVRILSIHKSKGLEFPVVIVPFHHQADPPGRTLAVERRHGLNLFTFRSGPHEDPVTPLLERLNLLYVAWTRPRDELYAFITNTSRSGGNSATSKALSVLLEELPFEEDVFSDGQPPPGAFLPVEPDSTEPETDFSLLPGDGQPYDGPQWLPRLKIFRNPQEGGGFTQRQRGLLAHACLEALSLTGDPAQDAARAVDQGMRAFPLPTPDPDAVRQDMERIVAWYAGLPEAVLWMRHGRPEQPLMDEDGSLRRVDLLVDLPDGEAVAVEYKTGRPDPAHAVQVSRYLAILGPALRRRQPDRQVRGMVVYLDQGVLEPVEEPQGGHRG